MSSTLKTFIRVRPTLPSDGAAAEALAFKGANQLQIRRAEEREISVDRVLNDAADNEALWDAVGRPALDVLERGDQAVVSVYGESGSGKSHCVVGLDDMFSGLVPRAIRALDGNAEANFCVLLIHEDNVMDVHTGHDGLKLKVDDSGCVAERSTVISIQEKEAGLEHMAVCLEKREELLRTLGECEQTVFTVYCFGAGAGRLTLIECPGSERVHKAGLKVEESQRLERKNKILSLYATTWQETAINADPKAIGWKDTKAGRFLQPALSLAMEGRGLAINLVTVINSKDHLFETMCSLLHAEATMKQDSLKSVSEYKELISYFEERLELNAKERAAQQAEMKNQEGNALRVKAANEAKLEELDEKERMLKQRVVQTRQQCEHELDRLKRELDKKKADLERRNAEEVERMRNLAKNAPAQAEADVKRKVAEVEVAHKEKMAAMTKQLEQLRGEIKENKELLVELREVKEQRDKEEAQAMRPVRELEKELEQVLAELKTAGKSREDGLSEQEILEKQTLWEARDDLDDLEEQIQKVALECMSLEYGLANDVGKPAELSDSSSSDDSSSSEGSGSSSEGSSASSSDSDDDSDDSDGSDEAEERARKMKEEMEQLAKEEEQKKLDREAYDKEWNHFRDTVKKDRFLQELLEKILLYLEYGTNVSVLSAKGFTRHFCFITKGRRGIALVEEVKEGAVPDKRSPLRTYSISAITGISMGQHSPNFQQHLKMLAGRVDPPRNDEPPTAEELEVSNMHKYYYRSFSLIFEKDEGYFDCVADTQTDFEAMIVAYHRISTRDAKWGKKLYIDFCEKIDDLEPFEREFCESCHLTPAQYLDAKEKILMTEERLFLTLHDIRVITGLDLFHSQKLLEVFTKQKWIVRRQLNYFKYQEKVLAAAEAAKSKLGGAPPTASAAGAGTFNYSMESPAAGESPAGGPAGADLVDPDDDVL